MWLADKIKEFEQRIEKLEAKDATNALDDITKQAWKIADEMFGIVRGMPKPHYTRGQKVECDVGISEKNWKVREYITSVETEDGIKHIVIWGKKSIEQYDDDEIRPLSKPEKPTFTRGQEVEVQLLTGWVQGLMVYPDAVASIVYVDEKRCSLPFMNENIRPLQTTEG